MPSKTDNASKKTAALRRVTEPADYVPPPKLLMRVIKKSADESGRPIVTMPAEAFTRLLEAALNAGFTEENYLARNADVNAGVVAGTIPTGLRHFAVHGYFEGRAPVRCTVDSEWYLQTYPDVKKAVAAGAVNDAQDHFDQFGYAEGRVPGPAFRQISADWNRIATPSKADTKPAAGWKSK